MKTPEDEMILAELIAAASEWGLSSCRQARFRDQNGVQLGKRRKRLPPAGAVSCCAAGAASLTSIRQIDMRYLILGNDDPYYMPSGATNEQSTSSNIGAAFEIAMREQA